MTVGVFTFVLLLGNGLKEVLPRVVDGQLSFGAVIEAIGLLVPWILIFALPMGMLTATLLIFGRFSADQELTAARASGISLVSLVTPILILSLCCCGVSALVNMEIGPRCRVAFTRMWFKLQAQLSSALVPEGQMVKDFPGYVFCVGKNHNGALDNVVVFALKQETNVAYTMVAKRGQLHIDTAKKELSLTLLECKYFGGTEGEGIPISFEEVTLPLQAPSAPGGSSVKLDDMTFKQLGEELRVREHQLQVALKLKHMTEQQKQQWKQNWSALRKDFITPVIFQINRQVAFSFACFGFALVGIPLGIRVHRRETNIGIVLALLLVAVYYSFIVLGHSLDNHPEYLPQLIVWIPNFLFQTIGAVLLWRANRDI